MASTFVSAGVYIQEKDNSLYAPAMAPTIIGIVGTATKGAVNTPTLITNEGQFTDTFGRPRTIDFGMHAALEALKACRLVYFVRIAGAAATYGSVTVSDSGSGPTAATIGPSSNTETWNLVLGSTESPVGTRTSTIHCHYDNGAGAANFTASFVGVQADVDSGNAGAYNLAAIDGGNPTTLTLKVDGGITQTITFSAVDPIVIANGGYAALTAAGAAHVINSQILYGEANYSVGGVKISSDTYGDHSIMQVTAAGNANNAVNGFNFPTAAETSAGNNVHHLDAVTAAEVETIIEAASALNVLVDVSLTKTVTFHTATTGAAKNIDLISASSSALGASPLINLTPLDSIVTGTNTTASAPTVIFRAKTYGSHSSDISVRVSTSAALTGTKKVEILYRGVVVETYDKLYKGTPVTGGYSLLTAINSGVTAAGIVASEWVTAVDAGTAASNPANGTYTLTSGLNGDNWTAGTVVGTIAGTTRTGMQIFRDPEQIYVNVLATPGVSYAAVIAEGLDICATRADCIYIADCPYGLSPANATSWHNGTYATPVTVDQNGNTETNATQFNSSYGALYYPFVQIFDKFNEQEIWVPPSAIVLRTFAYTDEVADPWFAPAGPNRTQAASVLDLEYSPSLGERDIMQITGNNVNPIAEIAGIGVTIMGQKTMQKATTSLDRVNVRRLLLQAEKVVADSVKFLLFEPNDSVMWRRFVNLVTPIFEDIKARRGLYDFRVVADSSTTTDTLINQNTFLGKIFLQPTKAAEKIIVAFNLVPTGANFEEYAQA